MQSLNQLYTHQESPVARVPIDRLIGNPIDIGGGKTIPTQAGDSTSTFEPAIEQLKRRARLAEPRAELSKVGYADCTIAVVVEQRVIARL